MGLFCGKKCECKRRCKGWFGPMPDIERSCKKACSSNTNLTKDGFLCSGSWIDQQVVMAAYGFDPCQGDNITIGGYLDPMDDRGANADKLEGLNDLFIILAILIEGGLGILFFIKK